MTIFASDTFTGTPTTELSAYNASWVQDGSFSTAHIGTEAGTYAVAYQSLESVYRYTVTPPSADYSVFGTISTLASAGGYEYGVLGRCAAAALTWYRATYDNQNSRVRLFKYVAGSQTQLGVDVSATIGIGASKSLELRMTGTAIALYLDSVLQISATDSDVTAAGVPGIYLSNGRITGVNDTGGMLDWSAAAAGGGGFFARPYYDMIAQSRMGA